MGIRREYDNISGNSSLFHGLFFPRTPDGQPDRAAIEASLPEMRAQFNVLDKAVAETGHLAGASFTYADINLLPVLAYLQSLPESALMLASAKHLTHYFDQHSQRASFVATVPPPMGDVTKKAS
jgi:glutathione S-transferase